MTAGLRAAGGPIVAAVGRDEVLRQRLIDRVAERWNRPLTVVRADGGFGKSVALAQAIRDNATDPTGEDVYVACRTFDRDASHLTRSLCAALDVPEPDATVADLDDLVDVIVDALVVRSPGRVCVILDDVHRWSPDSGAVLLVDALLSRLPANAHLVLSGRSVASRFVGPRTDGIVAEVVNGEELLFDPDELVAFAAAHGSTVDALAHCGGWPAMARLTLTARPGTRVDYLMEEVVEDLPDRLREALDAVILARVADDDLLTRLGLDASVAELLDRVPLLVEPAEGQVSAHDLWRDAAPLLAAPERRVQLGRSISAWHRSADRIDDAVDVACAVMAYDEAAAAVLRAVAESDAFLTEDRVGRWLTSLPTTEHDRAELCLLRGVWARLRGDDGLGLPESQRALAGFQERDHVVGVVAAALEVGLVAWFTGDLGVMLDTIALAERLYAEGVEGMSPLVRLARFAMADLSGDPAAALRYLDEIDPARTPDALLALVMRAQASQCFLLGLGERGASIAAELESRWPMPETRGIAALARWQSGDTGGVRGTWQELRAHRRGNHRDDFLHRVHAAIVDASFGIVADVDDLAPSSERSREVAFVALGRTSVAVTEGDEDRAARLLSELLDDVGLDDPLARNELRRFVTFPWVLSQQWRESDAAEDLGPTLHRKRRLADLLLRARRGPVEDWSTIEDGDVVFCAMPLRWSMELAAAAATDGDPRGLRLAQHLADLAGHPARSVLRDLFDADGRCAPGAAALLRSLPIEPDRVTHVVTCGRLRVAGADPALLRRRKVRQLLALTALRRSVTVDDIAALLWGDTDPAKVRPHLRTTLASARTALEPLRVPGAAPFHLRRDGDVLRLHRSDRLDVDLWTILELLGEARRHRQAGRIALAVAASRRAVAAWSGPVLEELVDVEGLAAEVEGVRRDLLGAAVDVAEWDHAHGEHAEAARLAGRVLDADPYDERAHRVNIAARLSTGATDDALLAAMACERSLAELGSSPTPDTAAVIKRVRRHVGAG